MEQNNIEKIEDFKDVLLKYNKKRNKGTIELLLHVSNNGSFLMTEMKKVLQLLETGSKEDIKKAQKSMVAIRVIYGHLNIITSKSIKGQDYEKRLELFVKKLKKQSEEFQTKFIEEVEHMWSCKERTSNDSFRKSELNNDESASLQTKSYGKYFG